MSEPEPVRSSARAMAPQSIALPPPPVFASFFLAPDKSPLTPLDSALHFHSAPSSPTTPPVHWYTPPTTPSDALPPSEPMPPSAPLRVPRSPDPTALPVPISPHYLTDDAFPNTVVDVAVDFGFGDDDLTTLEKIYLYSKSESSIHRVFIAHKLPAFLDHVAPQEAIEYVLPLIEVLAVDEDEAVKEALAAELVPVIWWFFSHCQIIPDDPDTLQSFASTSTTATISVQAFTPILATLLLSSNPLIVGSARFAVVDLLTKMRRADDRDSGIPSPDQSSRPRETDLTFYPLSQDDDDVLTLSIGLFGLYERDLFRQEILQSVVIGMGRLDIDAESLASDLSQPQSPGSDSQHSRPQDRPKSPHKPINPYFPTSTSTADSPHSSAQRQSTESLPVSPPSAIPPFSWNRFRSNERSSPATSPSLHPLESLPATSPSESGLRSVDQTDDDEQAAIGQLSSMSLMAAVTATGLMAEDIQRAFVKEVERVGRNSAYFYVRREASLALGALAKVVPQELVTSSLLPLFDALRWDPDWRVRHSALFALPAILPRLSPNKRRTVALETTMALSSDKWGAVRSSVMESLGEVLYTFHLDPGGPPPELLEMFLGRTGDGDIRLGKVPLSHYPWMPDHKPEEAAESFYTDSERPLVCAFNFPAVALTLGASRWHQLREAYADLSKNTNNKVRKTLAASLGQLAKIVGRDATLEDLVPLWWTCVRHKDEEVRTKSIESLELLLPVLNKKDRIDILNGVLEVWNEGTFRGWRERDAILGFLNDFVELGGPAVLLLVETLLVKGLEDTVASVRQLAIRLLPRVWSAVASDHAIVQSLQGDLKALATSPSYKRRMTFVACLQSCVTSLRDGSSLPLDADMILKMVEPLVGDPVVDVRIGIARLLNVVHSNSAFPLFGLVHSRLSADPSHEVRSYLPDILAPGSQRPVSSVASSVDVSHSTRLNYPHPTTFSRPPPLRSSS